MFFFNSETDYKILEAVTLFPGLLLALLAFIHVLLSNVKKPWSETEVVTRKFFLQEK